MARICLAPVLALLLMERDQTLAAVAVFGIAMASDALDGHLARSRGLVTTFGKLMDPVADKLVVGAAFVCLAATDRIEPWVVAVILSREAAVTGLRMLAKRDGLVISANSLGKAKTVLQTACVFVLVLASDPAAAWVELVVWATVLITIASGLVYVYRYLAYRRGRDEIGSAEPAPDSLG
jgi:CDP-diacylglycerol--glycerol-3-phosphate 3-phosphatidyltransferase